MFFCSDASILWIYIFWWQNLIGFRVTCALFRLKRQHWWRVDAPAQSTPACQTVWRDVMHYGWTQDLLLAESHCPVRQLYLLETVMGKDTSVSTYRVMDRWTCINSLWVYPKPVPSWVTLSSEATVSTGNSTDFALPGWWRQRQLRKNVHSHRYRKGSTADLALPGWWRQSWLSKNIHSHR